MKTFVENICGGQDLGEPEQPSQIQEDIYNYISIMRVEILFVERKYPL